MKNKFIQSAKIVALGVVLAGGATLAWVAPTATPPGANATPPWNIDSSAQVKRGQFILKSTPATASLYGNIYYDLRVGAVADPSGLFQTNTLTVLGDTAIGGRLVVKSATPPNFSSVSPLHVNGQIRSAPLVGTGNRPLCADTAGHIILCPATTPPPPPPPPPSSATQYRLAVGKSGNHAGAEVTSNPAGVNCPAGCLTTFPTGHLFNSGTSVTIISTIPAEFSSQFWGGTPTGECNSSTTCTVVMSADKTISIYYY